MLHHGSRDLGFAGADWVAELGAELVEVFDTGLDPVRLVAAAPEALLADGGLPARHVTVASEYVRLAKAWADLAGVVFFLYPMMGFLFWWSLPGVQRSWRLLERSQTNDGLEYVYLMKTVIPVFCVLLMIQGLSMAIRSVLVIVRSKQHG